MEYFGYILLSVVILLVMVTIHELGHYVAAKILGFTVNEFSIGFGPKIFGKNSRTAKRSACAPFRSAGIALFSARTMTTTRPRRKAMRINRRAKPRINRKAITATPLATRRAGKIPKVTARTTICSRS